MFVFILGREFRLSLAEIQSLFPHAFFEYTNEQFALVSDISEEEIRDKFAYIGGTIKVIKILDEVRDVPDFMTVATDYLKRADRTNKVPFAVAGYGEKLDNFATGLRIKKFLKSCEDKSFRLVNKEPKNINSAVYKKERLGESETEVNFVKAGKISYFGVTIAYQDVDVYAERDMDKTRDMGVGMLPPKLAQMMINLTSPHPQPFSQRARGEIVTPSTLGGGSGRGMMDDGKILSTLSFELLSLYDPFCGLGTILIEAANMGYENVFWSDISPEMVQASKKSMENFLGKRDESGSVIVSGAKQSRSNEPFSKAEDSKTSSEWRNYFIFEGDASKIAATIPDSLNTKTTAIVTEGYLGEVLNARTITADKIQEQCRKLARIYDGFFRDLRTIGFRGTIVISFPFWDNRGKDVFFEDILPIIDRYGFERQELLSGNLPFRTTPHQSLLYRRPGQTVGREIYKLRLAPKEKLGLRL